MTREEETSLIVKEKNGELALNKTYDMLAITRKILGIASAAKSSPWSEPHFSPSHEEPHRSGMRDHGERPSSRFHEEPHRSGMRDHGERPFSRFHEEPYRSGMRDRGGRPSSRFHEESHRSGMRDRGGRPSSQFYEEPYRSGMGDRGERASFQSHDELHRSGMGDRGEGSSSQSHDELHRSGMEDRGERASSQFHDEIKIRQDNSSFTSCDEVCLDEIKDRGDVSVLGPYGETYRDEITGMEFVWIPPGSFEMGDVLGDNEFAAELPVHWVNLQGFYLGKYAVTQGEWQKVMGKNPSKFKKGDRYPVEQVSWNDVQKFIKKLNKKSKKIYRLPSEAQWEYAAREGGKRVRFGNGKDIIDPNEANFDGSESYKKSYSRIGIYREETVPVESFFPNSLGLYNMSGNVYEWCQDCYHDTYEGAPTDGSAWESGDGSFRIFRGGCWSSIPWRLRTSIRIKCKVNNRANGLGCRLLFLV